MPLPYAHQQQQQQQNITGGGDKNTAEIKRILEETREELKVNYQNVIQQGELPRFSINDDKYDWFLFFSKFDFVLFDLPLEDNNGMFYS